MSGQLSLIKDCTANQMAGFPALSKGYEVKALCFAHGFTIRSTPAKRVAVNAHQLKFLHSTQNQRKYPFFHQIRRCVINLIYSY